MFAPVIESFRLLSRQEKTLLLALVASRAFVQILDVLGLVTVGLLGAMLASGLTSKNQASFLGLSIKIESSETFLWVVLIVAGFFLAKSALASVLLRLTTRFLAEVEARSSAQLVQYLFTGGLERLKQYSRGEHIWIAGQSSHVAFGTMLFAASALVTESTLFILIFGAFVFVDVSTALIITAYFGTLILVFQLSINQRLKRLGQRLADSSVEINNTIYDLLSSFREALVLERREYFLNKFNGFRRRYALDHGLQRFVVGLPRFVVEAALMLGFLALVVWQFARGTLSEGLVTTAVFLTGGVRMMAALLPLQNAIADIRTQGPQATRAQEIIRQARSAGSGEKSDAQANRNTRSLKMRGGYLVRLDDVSFAFPDSEHGAVNEVSLELARGQFVALIGPSGAGKTTLADLILGVHSPTGGSVTIEGISPEAMRRIAPGKIAYVPQDPGMVSGSIAENIALGLPKQDIDRRRVRQVLRDAELWSAVAQLPEKEDTTLGSHADALSRGQIQRLGIARALYSKPQLLLLDEATSALDAQTESSVSRGIEKLKGNTTIFVIAHRLSTIQSADVVFVMDQGRIIASGSFSEVRAKVPLVENYVQLMSITPNHPVLDAK